MSDQPLRRRPAGPILLACALAGLGHPVSAEGPRLGAIDPPGGRAGTSVDVRVIGSALDGLTGLRCDEPRITATALGGQRFTVKIPGDLPPGLYDLRALGANGLSSPRAFFVSPHPVLAETGPPGQPDIPRDVPLDVSVCGTIEAPGDVDAFRFHARAGRRVAVECWAERLDSKLRAVLELEDVHGRRVASNRGHTGLDPMIDYLVPADGEFVVRVFDLTYSGSSEHHYRFDIDAGPRVAFAVPNVVEEGKTTRVTFFGQNLGGGDSLPLSRVEADVTPPARGTSGLPRIFLRTARLAAYEFPFDVACALSPVALGVTDVPVLRDGGANHRPEDAQTIAWPCEVSGQLEAGDEKDWYLVRARRGEVIWLELLGERIGSPVDLDLAVLDGRDGRELLHLADGPERDGAGEIALGDTDPSGRWVAPADGNYLLLVRNVIGGPGRDPRRVYRLSVRREDADFQLLAAPGGGRDPGGWNVGRGGRALLELVALRRRGLDGPIRVAASGLPAGIECPDVWLGPGVDRVPVVVTAGRDCGPVAGALTLTGHADLGGVAVVRRARGAALIANGPPTPSARLTGIIPLAAGPEAPWIVTATPSRTDVSQGSIIDVSVDVDVKPGMKAGPVALAGVGVPAEGDDRIATIPAGERRGWFSLQVPGRLPPGPYTFAIRADASLTAAKGGAVAATAYSNPVTIRVVPGAIDLRLDPGTPRKIRRGEVVQLRYQALRRNGFIGKIHTVLNAAEGVSGLRARGVTFVGQVESGVLQVVASDDAPLGRQPSLRLEAVGTVEDEPIHQAGCFLDLEIAD